MKSHYEVLGVERGANAGAIKKAYRKRVLDQHPDKHPGDKDVEERFKLTNLAYEILKDPKKKAMYDMGFSSGGKFDPTNIDPSLLDYDVFIKTFTGLFGQYLDEVIPGGFKDRVRRAATQADVKAREKKKPTKKKKSKKNSVPACGVCFDTGRIALQQGSFMVFVTCRACESRKAS